MRYLVIVINPVTREKEAFYTYYFDNDKYNPELEMIVVDRFHNTITFDGGESWQEIEMDHI